MIDAYALNFALYVVGVLLVSRLLYPLRNPVTSRFRAVLGWGLFVALFVAFCIS